MIENSAKASVGRPMGIFDGNCKRASISLIRLAMSAGSSSSSSAIESSLGGGKDSAELVDTVVAGWFGPEVEAIGGGGLPDGDTVVD